MQTKEFYKFVIRIIFACVTGAVLLAVVLYNRGPHVRLVTFDSPVETTALTRNHSLTLHFDRPISQQDFSEAVQITPYVDTKITTQEQGLLVTFKESLHANTEYELTLDPSITDKSQKRMANTFSYRFKTGPAKYAYLQRNYDVSLDDPKSHFDKVLLGEVGSDTEKTIYEASEIRSFTANSSYAVVSVAGDSSDNIVTIDLETNKIQEAPFRLDGTVNNIVLAARGKTALFTIQIDFDTATPEYYRQHNNRLYALDLDTQQLRQLTNETDEPLQAFKVSITHDGQIALINDGLTSYYAVSPYNDYDPILLGSHDYDYGFNDTGMQIIFRDVEQLSSYDLAQSKLIERAVDAPGYIQLVTEVNNDLFVIATDYTDRTVSSRSQVLRSDGWDSDFKGVWQESENEAGLLRGVHISHGADYIALQLNPKNCEFDQVNGNSQCRKMKTAIYNVESGEPAKSLNGFDLVWLP